MSAVLTTTPPKTRINVTVPITFVSLSPLHHGAGVSGNTQKLRTQPATNPWTGETYNCPIVSGNSLRHAIRDACAELTLGAVDAQPGTLSKPLVDLLYSGGALTGSEGANVDLDRHRQLDHMWPPAGLLGYAGRGQIWAGTLYADFLLPVCTENLWRTPERRITTEPGQPKVLLRDLPAASEPVSALREEEFGTRHDIIGAAPGRWVDHDMWAGLDAKERTSQMIYDWEVTRAGTVWYGTLHLAAATIVHAQALRAAWDWLTAHGTIHLGAKRAQGFGLCRPEADWSQLPDPDPSWVAELSDHRDEVMSLLHQAAGK